MIDIEAPSDNEVSATLMREKFIIAEIMDDGASAEPIMAFSNRLNLPLRSASGMIAENFIIRAQNMHVCTRMAAHLARDFQDTGPLINRQKPYDWEQAFNNVVRGYERDWNADLWVAIYYKGRVIFDKGPGTRHSFLDVIEQCDALNKGDYGQSLEIAKDAFQQAGKTVTIAHDVNIALVLHVSAQEGRCGIILRIPERTMTFNFTAKRKHKQPVKLSQCLAVSAAFLEGIQLSFQVGVAKKKLQYDLIAPLSQENRMARAAGQKLGSLNKTIDQFENLLDVTYRPERPSFKEISESAERYAQKSLREQPGNAQIIQ